MRAMLLGHCSYEFLLYPLNFLSGPSMLLKSVYCMIMSDCAIIFNFNIISMLQLLLYYRHCVSTFQLLPVR